MTTQEAIDLFGSQAELARALGLSKQAVNQWGTTVPLLREYQLREILAQRAEDNGEPECA